MLMALLQFQVGLALSSRNGYLSEENRQIAPMIYKTLKNAEQELLQAKPLDEVLESIKVALTGAGFIVDYVEARSLELQKVETFNQDVVLFVAAKIGATRLIDNLQVKYIS